MRYAWMALWIMACCQALSGGGFRKKVLSRGLEEPIQVGVARNGDVYFAERRGAVKVWRSADGETRELGRLKAFSGSEDGVLGLVLDPGFETNRWIYLYHSTIGVLENRVSRFEVQGDHLVLESQQILVRVPTLPKKPNHSGGGLAFDGRGNLYLGTGDYTFIQDSNGYSPLDERPGREVFDSQRTAANSMDLRGKILRIHPEASGGYSIPEGNLFPVGQEKTLPEIFIMGCRNPFRLSVDRVNGWLMWGDVGPDALVADEKRGPAGYDEFNVARKAGNFGWPYFVGNNKAYCRYNFEKGEAGESWDPLHPVNPSPNSSGIRELPPAEPALIWYPPGFSARFPSMGSGPRSAMSGPVYHYQAELESPVKFPQEWDGVWFIFEWERGWVKGVRLGEEGELREIRDFAPEITWKRPISMEFGSDGALYGIEWGTAWFNNTDAQVVRLEWIEE